MIRATIPVCLCTIHRFLAWDTHPLSKWSKTIVSEWADVVSAITMVHAEGTDLMDSLMEESRVVSQGAHRRLSEEGRCVPVFPADSRRGGRKVSDMNQKQMILHENLWKVMWRISWPAIAAMLLYGLNSVFDAIFVGRYVGETALAGVSLAYPLSQMTLGIGSLIGVGAGAALSIAIGSGDRWTQRRMLGNVNLLSLMASLVFGVAAYAFAEPLVRFMGGQGEALAQGVDYFRVTVVGSLFWIHGLACNMVVRAEGKMKTAAVMMGGGLACNILANFLFVALMRLGATGAAWGTNLGMLVYTVMGLSYFRRGKASFEADPFRIHLDGKIVKAILSMGMSSLIMSVMSLVQATVVFNALSRYGTTMDIAFYGATYRIYTLLLTPLFGLMRRTDACTAARCGVSIMVLGKPIA